MSAQYVVDLTVAVIQSKLFMYGLNEVLIYLLESVIAPFLWSFYLKKFRFQMFTIQNV